MTRQTNNPATGIVGIRIGGPVITSEADHFYCCAACGQAVDMRDLGQVFHHKAPGHALLPDDDMVMRNRSEK